MSVIPYPTKTIHGVKATTWPENILLFGLPASGVVAAYYYISPALTEFMPLSEARMLAGYW